MKPKIHFLISAPRSGSTWLTRLLNHHPQIFGTELRLFGDFFELWPNNNGRLAPRITLDAYARGLSVHYFHEQHFESRREFINEYVESYIDFVVNFAAQRSGKSVIVDKITPYPGTAKIVIEKIRKYFPESRVIQLIRDGRDVVTSGCFDWLLKDQNSLSRHRVFLGGEPLEQLDRFFDDESLRKWSSNWRESLEIFDDYDSELKITYEEMLADPSAVLSRCFDALKVSVDNEAINLSVQQESFQAKAGRNSGQSMPTDKIRRGIAGDWRNYFTRRDGFIFLRCTKNWLVDCGYEFNGDWVDSLPERLSLDKQKLGLQL